MAYALSLPEGSPLFPDKELDSHGNRGGRGWNVTGKTLSAFDNGKAA